ncbi:hypothetical protein TPHA_0G00740 [Tetrapisispora phaffii CBS 4417]|uniref:Letm1 RBD domain-containing protein n=1 Tax=Tetrapisispora phaffii (strain ATCC 24235 / CBS 4417 / NBRC 1672 / NRRL Y-8282 / UCD 70-5) TaxID=1071381 RepID=G8BVI2_TETPH|nr:hypothetical protein TPHA_0G00740 [Tetrapisispora phaffii CBS 4417]CCE63910.1 hypothetical protein TPHA_0G00740 [Tetrapisispora phaffii CBS 4417]
MFNRFLTNPLLNRSSGIQNTIARFKHVSANATTYPLPERLINFSTKNDFNESLQNNETLRELMVAYQKGNFKIVDAYADEVAEELNSIRSLPRTIFPKDEIFQKVDNDKKIGQWRKPAMKWIRTGLHLMKYYRNGMHNTIKVFRETKSIPKRLKDQSQTPLVTKLFHIIEINEIEYSKLKLDTIKTIPITRKEFVEYSRRKEIWKLPIFFLVALIFEEMTAIICYFFPRMVPYNCLTPGGFKHLSLMNIKKSKPSILTKNSNSTYISPYSASRETVYGHLQGKLSDLYISSWKLRICKLTNNKTIPSEALMTLYHHTFVDDWLVLQHILHNKNNTVLSYEELVNMILLRKLYKPTEDLNKMSNDDLGRKVLVWRLIFYWSYRFNNVVTTHKNSMSHDHETPLFSQKWGVSNISTFNNPGTLNGELFEKGNLNIFK